MKVSNFSPRKSVALLLNKRDVTTTTTLRDEDDEALSSSSVDAYIDLDYLCGDYARHCAEEGGEYWCGGGGGAAEEEEEGGDKKAGGLFGEESCIQIFDVSAVSGEGVEVFLEWLCCVVNNRVR